MEKQDNLGKFMKELPGERPSENFTKMVMDRVNLERKNTPVVYQPLISRQGWRRIILGIIFFVIGFAVVWSYFPGNGSPSLLQPLYSLDFSGLLKPYNLIESSQKKSYLDVEQAICLYFCIKIPDHA